MVKDPLLGVATLKNLTLKTLFAGMFQCLHEEQQSQLKLPRLQRWEKHSRMWQKTSVV